MHQGRFLRGQSPTHIALDQVLATPLPCACTPHYAWIDRRACVACVVSMIVVMMSAASSGALMGLALTTHASTPVLTTRLPTVQMATIGQGLAALQDIADDVADRWYDRKDMGARPTLNRAYAAARTPAYGPNPLRQAMREQRVSQQGYGLMPMQMLNSGDTWPPGSRKTWSDSVGQVLTLLQSRRNDAGRYAEIPLWEAAPYPVMPQQSYGMMPQQRGMRRRAMRQQGYGHDHDINLGLDDIIDTEYGPGMEYGPDVDQFFGMPQEGYGQMVPRQQWQSYASTGWRPSSGRLSQAEVRAERRAGMAGDLWAEESGEFDFPMPQQQRGRMPTYGDSRGVAGPSVFRTRTSGSVQALSAVDGDASMNSFADGSGSMTGEVDRKWLSHQWGYGRVPKYGQGLNQMQ